MEEHREAWRALFRDAAEPDVAELIARMQREAAAVVGALMEPADTGGDPVARDLRVAMHAQLLSGGIQSLATWWHEHPDVPRAVLVDEAMAWGWEVPGRPAPVRPDAR